MKILISPGFGAGWSTWASDRKVKWIMLTFPQLIEAVESAKDGALINPTKPSGSETDMLKAFLERTAEVERINKNVEIAIMAMCDHITSLGYEKPYLGGRVGLDVVNVSSRFRVDESDGKESVVDLNADDGDTWTVTGS